MRATDPSRATVTREDIDQAQAVINAWKADAVDAEGFPVQIGTRAHMLLRGLITQALTDAHAQGYDQGVARGRHLVANTVRDALDGEGL